MQEQTIPELLGLTATIVSAPVAHNKVDAGEVPALIQSVHRSLITLGEPGAAPAVAPTPAVPIKKSVFPDYIVCLEDGKTLKMLKRHLKTSYGMTPATYREKWSLPSDYPMVAPSYASHRSTLAKKIGLGRKPAAAEPEVTQLPAQRARGAKK